MHRGDSLRLGEGRDGLTPGVDLPGLGGEEEVRRAMLGSRLDDARVRAGEDGAGWGTPGDLDGERDLGHRTTGDVALVERRDVGAVVGHPGGGRRLGAERQAPGIDEARVAQVGLAGLVGDEVVSLVLAKRVAVALAR